VERRETSTENAQKGDSPGDSFGSHWDLALSTKVVIRGLSAPISRWKVGCDLLWTDGSWGLLSRLHFLTEPQITIIVEKQKVIFLLHSGAHFFVLLLSPGPLSNNKFIIRGILVNP
jgi:hypothetical protein